MEHLESFASIPVAAAMEGGQILQAAEQVRYLGLHYSTDMTEHLAGFHFTKEFITEFV